MRSQQRMAYRSNQDIRIQVRELLSKNRLFQRKANHVLQKQQKSQSMEYPISRQHFTLPQSISLST